MEMTKNPRQQTLNRSWQDQARCQNFTCLDGTCRALTFFRVVWEHINIHTGLQAYQGTDTAVQPSWHSFLHRFGSPVRFKLEYDVYSFGLILLEIELWTTLPFSTHGAPQTTSSGKKYHKNIATVNAEDGWDLLASNGTVSLQHLLPEISDRANASGERREIAIVGSVRASSC
jgi:hypothetical protein